MAQSIKSESGNIYIYIYLKETNDFAGDVAGVPGDRYLPDDVRQDANDTDA